MRKETPLTERLLRKGVFFLVLAAREPSVKPLATATTAASGGNREELLGPRPAGCER